MSGAPKDYYTSMVFNSNYADPQQQQPFAVAAPPKKSSQPYRTPYSSTPHTLATMPDGMVVPMTAAPVNPSTLSPLVPPQQRSVRQSPYMSMRTPSGYETMDLAKPSMKMYTHNPYASTCTAPPLTLSMTPAMMDGGYQSPYTPSNARSSAATTPQSTSASTFPVYTPSEGAGGESQVLAATLEEQFLGMVGSIAATAMSSRGRHLLLSVLRLQHMDKIQLIYNEIAPQFNAVAVDQHGCHVVRTLIEYISTPQMERLVPFMEPAVLLQMATATQHTRRVVQAIFEHHHSPALMPIVDVVRANCRHLSMTQQGCIVVIRIVEYAEPAQKRALIADLVPILPVLATDQFGNYVVQCILKNMSGYVSLEDLVESFQGHWVELSCDKYSSNVMERIIGMLKGPLRQHIVHELILEVSNLQCLMQNSFGNYVLQAVIGTAVDPYEFKVIYDAVTPFLHTSPYGHRIEAKLKNRHEGLYKNAPMPQSAMEGPKK